MSKSSVQEELKAGPAPNVSKTSTLTVQINDQVKCDILDDVGEDFSWEEYLSITDTETAPPSAFHHVEHSLTGIFQTGSLLEIPNRFESGVYWLASITGCYGPVIHMRYVGPSSEDMGKKADVICDTRASYSKSDTIGIVSVHSLGWCKEHNRQLKPPKFIQAKIGKTKDEWHVFMSQVTENAKTVGEKFLHNNAGCTTPVDFIKQDVLDEERPSELVWVYQVIENYGGRLLLRPEGAEVTHGHHDFFLFYTDYRLRPLKWGSTNGLTYKPPEKLRSAITDPKSVADSVLLKEQEVIPDEIFREQLSIVIEPHHFKKGYKLEAINPHHPSHVGPATVVEVVDDKFFVVEMDDLRDEKPSKQSRQFTCHKRSPNIFPVQWSVANEVSCSRPRGWGKPDLLWSEYLQYWRQEVTPGLPVEAAPDTCFNLEDTTTSRDHGFSKGVKLEAVNPLVPRQVYVATVTKCVDNLLWLHFDMLPKGHRSPVIVECTSHEIFPAGWAESNGVTLKYPSRWRGNKAQEAARLRALNMSPAVEVLRVAQEEAEVARAHFYIRYPHCTEFDDMSWCPRLYVNHTCTCGPQLSKIRVASMARSLGPGPIGLVLRDVVSMLVKSAYKQTRALALVHVRSKGEDPEDTQVVRVKACHLAARVSAWVSVPRHPHQVAGYCRRICQRLEACPYLVSPVHYPPSQCPAQCPPTKIPTSGVSFSFTRRRLHRAGSIGSDSSKESSAEPPDNPRQRKRSISIMGGVGVGGGKGRRGAARNSLAGGGGGGGRMKTRGAKLPYFGTEPRKRRLGCDYKPASSKGQPGVKRVKSEESTVVKGKSPPVRESFVNYGPFGVGKLTRRLSCNTTPSGWSVADIERLLSVYHMPQVARLLADQEVDGTSFMLLTLPNLRGDLDLEVGTALKVCHLVVQVKKMFLTNFSGLQYGSDGSDADSR